MSSEVTFELTAQDHVDAVHAHTGRILGKIAWALLAVSLLYPVIDLWARTPILEDTAFFIFFGLALLFLAWDYLARDWTVRRAFRQSLPMRSPIRLAWDEQAIGFHTEMSDARYEWSRFFRWRASKTTMLLYRDSQLFLLVPRRVLPEGAMDEMIAGLTTAGVKQR